MKETNDCSEGFCGIGTWQGVAEVYDGQGRFLANGADQRHVRTLEHDGRTRIDLSFVGPLKFAGHYYIQNNGDHRLYQGPVNCGYATALGKDCVSAHAYWPVTGLSQKFFLMVSPDGNRQLSIALMSRGEQLLYVVLGENARVIGGQPLVEVPVINGIAYDLQNDPCAGRAGLLLHQSGSWEGTIFSRRAGENQTESGLMQQRIRAKNGELELSWNGSRFAADTLQAQLKTNQWLAWSEAGSFVGSYSLYGGRGLSGQFHDLSSEQRVWRRELVTADGRCKAIINVWYRGEQQLGTEWGFLEFRPDEA